MSACATTARGLSRVAVIGLLAVLASGARGAVLGDRSPAAEAPYPNRPIRLVVTFPPGGGTDVLARILGARLGEAWSEQVVIDNRPGASGNIGAEIVARAVPDGHTLLMVNSTFAMNAGLYSKLRFDSLRDFSAVARVASTSGIVAAHPSLGVRNIPELLAAARAQAQPRDRSHRERACAARQAGGATFRAGTVHAGRDGAGAEKRRGALVQAHQAAGNSRRLARSAAEKQMAARTPVRAP